MSILPIFIPHAGCPHQCIFCNQKAISGQKSAALVSAEKQIERWLAWLKPSTQNEAAFYGGSFTGLDIQLQKQLLSLTDELVAKKIIGSVRLSTRPDYIDSEKLELLKQHHVELIELGVQSLDDNVLKTAERGHTAEAVYDAVQLIRRYGFKLGLQLMVGMPGQNFASVKATAGKVVDLRPDICRIYPLLVIKDTPLEKMYRNSLFVPLTLSEAIEQSAYMYKILTENNIKVIRVGLQPDDELCREGNIIAGPFHPSMGELVQSFIVKENITAMIENLPDKKTVIINTPLKMESKVRGMRNQNILFWKQKYPESEIIIRKSSGDEITVTDESFL